VRRHHLVVQTFKFSSKFVCNYATTKKKNTINPVFTKIFRRTLYPTFVTSIICVVQSRLYRFRLLLWKHYLSSANTFFDTQSKIMFSCLTSILTITCYNKYNKHFAIIESTRINFFLHKNRS
jgi:hypothetical protein